MYVKEINSFHIKIYKRQHRTGIEILGMCRITALFNIFFLYMYIVAENLHTININRSLCSLNMFSIFILF